MVTFARGLRLTVGAAVTSLHPLDEGTARVKVGTGIASLRFTRTWDEGRGVRQDLDVEYDARGGLASLGSDLEYRRHQVRGSYRYQHGHSTVTLTGLGGLISGRAPLFERFTLGDSSTLRGWNKYDLAPAGATRAFHQSVEYRYRKLAYFIDAGSLWNTDETRRIRLSTGIGVHSDNGFLTVGFPINADDVSATVILGVRF
jgi:outer membrane protein assembly factor BamA